jgi:hypothetical protein
MPSKRKKDEAKQRPKNEAIRRKLAAMTYTGRVCRRHYDEGTCPICGKPSYTWPDGVRRLTCKSDKCFRAWVQPGHDQEEEEETE